MEELRTKMKGDHRFPDEAEQLFAGFEEKVPRYVAGARVVRMGA